MQATADFHTHTVYSHGKGTVEENVQAAIKRGLKTIGISDHGPGHFFIGIGGINKVRQLRKEIKSLQQKYPQIEILLGMEANIVDVDGTIDVTAEMLAELDYLLVGYHKLVRPRSMAAFCLGAQNFTAGWLDLKPERLRQQNTAAICAAVERYPVKAVTHPGLQIDIDTKALAAACIKTGTLMEINSAYAEKLEDYVKIALRLGANFIVNSDAHTPERVGDFSAAYRLIEKVKIPLERLVNITR
ncbi:MAG: PHP domain-containing protein [Firmicutes bacterium]|nr:PHP domain-containing protein [Bacillota bacterium]